MTEHVQRRVLLGDAACAASTCRVRVEQYGVRHDGEGEVEEIEKGGNVVEEDIGQCTPVLHSLYEIHRSEHRKDDAQTETPCEEDESFGVAEVAVDVVLEVEEDCEETVCGDEDHRTEVQVVHGGESSSEITHHGEFFGIKRSKKY